MNTLDPDMTELEERIARLEADLAETRRVNAAWRALHLRSELVLGRISKRFDEMLQPGVHDDIGPASSRDATRNLGMRRL